MRSDLSNQFIDARLNAGHSQRVASVECKCALSSITNLETQDKEPAGEAVMFFIKKYITKYHPDNQPQEN